jgi:hypothetical protein
MMLWQKSNPVAPELPPRTRRWPTILGITVAAWALLGGALLFLLPP